ncbi:molecular chaperone Hsp20 [Halobacteriales archaeon SW_7_68_16]|nr:MAG: molecular chaperone Hsp20 [Halobacteriales archaeon SW_7_68_16]
MSGLREALGDLPDAVFADLLESNDAYRLVIDMPGVTADTTDVTVDRNRIRIEARREKSVPPEFRYLREDRALFLDTELPLPPDATDAGAAATVEGGVLTITLPKRGEPEATTIEVRDAGTDDHDHADGEDHGDDTTDDA